jgi:hypothetical protein
VRLVPWWFKCDVGSGTGKRTSPSWSPGNLRHSSCSPLVLLPSGSDTVRRTTMHRARTPCRARIEPHMAERAGFEPAVELPPHTLSKRAPSASRTPLQRFSKRLAERKGFEPLDLVKGQRFSRPPRSTTPAPLRDRAPYSTTIAVVWQRSSGATLDTCPPRDLRGVPAADRVADRWPDRSRNRRRRLVYLLLPRPQAGAGPLGTLRRTWDMARG